MRVLLLLASVTLAWFGSLTVAHSQPVACVNLIQFPQQFLACTLNAINAARPLGALNLPAAADAVATLSASVVIRRNDLLLGNDAGLGRQIDLLMPGWSEGPNGDIGPKPYGLGAARFGAGLPNGALLADGEQSPQLSDTPRYALGAGSRSLAPRRPAFNVWADGYLSHFSDDRGQLDSQGHSGVLYVGADYVLSPQIVIGALVQFDQTEQSFDGFTTRASDTGWMAGPYVAVRLSNNLFFQGRAAWGRSDNKIQLDQSHTDQFAADRWLIRGTLLGQWRSGPWQFRPRASVGYIAEDQESYVSSLNVLIPEQTVSLWQAKAGPEIAYQYRTAEGVVIEPNALLEGIWNIDQSGGALKIDDFVVGDKLRGRAEAGATIFALNGWSLGASVSYDGIGSGDYHAIGGRVRVRMPFN